MNLLELIATTLSLIGTVLVTRKKHSGFAFWSVANLGWIYIDWTAGLKGQAVLFIVYLGLALYGLYEWRRG